MASHKSPRQFPYMGGPNRLETIVYVTGTPTKRSLICGDPISHIQRPENHGHGLSESQSPPKRWMQVDELLPDGDTGMRRPQARTKH